MADMERPNWMSKLLEQGYIAYSKAGSQAAMQTLTNLATLGLVKFEAQGSRRKIIVLDANQFRHWVEANYPLTDPLATAELPVRSQNIARRRNSKGGQTSHDIQPILLKWFDPDPSVPLAQLTHQYGLVGLTSDRLSSLSLAHPWRLLTVENWESFYTLDYPEPSALIVAVYLSGQVADVTLAALAQLSPPPDRVLHFGDYDWIGLSIFQRLKAAIPIAALYIPADFAALLQKYGNRALIVDQAARSSLDINDPACRPVIHMIAECNAGLEQEIVSPPAEVDFYS